MPVSGVRARTGAIWRTDCSLPQESEHESRGKKGRPQGHRRVAAALEDILDRLPATLGGNAPGGFAQGPFLKPRPRALRIVLRYSDISNGLDRQGLFVCERNLWVSSATMSPVAKTILSSMPGLCCFAQ